MSWHLELIAVGIAIIYPLVAIAGFATWYAIKKLGFAHRATEIEQSRLKQNFYSSKTERKYDK